MPMHVTGGSFFNYKPVTLTFGKKFDMVECVFLVKLELHDYPSINQTKIMGSFYSFTRRIILTEYQRNKSYNI